MCVENIYLYIYIYSKNIQKSVQDMSGSFQMRYESLFKISRALFKIFRALFKIKKT